MAILLSFGLVKAQNYAIYNGSSGPSSNAFIKTNSFPSSTLSSIMFQVGLNYAYRQNRAIFYGGNIGVSQDQSTYGNYLGKWSFKGAWKLSADYSWVPPNQQFLVNPGLNYLVDYHRWGDYDAHFGLRERATDVGLYMTEPGGGNPNIPPNPQGLIKDAVITWSHEYNKPESRLIFQNILGVDGGAWAQGQIGPYPVAKEHATILSNGKMGVGTPTPNAHLEVRANTVNPTVDGLIVSNINGAEQLIVKNNGNVGINNNSPQEKLDVLGNSIFKGNMRLSLPTGSPNTNDIFNINNQSGNGIMSVKDNGKIFINNFPSSIDQGLFIKPTGEVFAAPSPLANTWLITGNDFPAGTSGTLAFGTTGLGDVGYDFFVSGQTIIKVDGSPTQKGFTSFRKNMAIGGFAPLNFANPTPNVALFVKSTSSTSVPNNINHSILKCQNNSNFDMLDVTNSVIKLMNGYVEITGSEFKLDMDFIPNGFGNYNIGNSTNYCNEIWGSSYPTTSDIRLKENINKLENSLNKIKKMNPVSYNYIGKNKTTNGFIAQEMVNLVPNSVIVPKHDSEYYAINYDALIPVLTKGIQEQQQIIDTLKQQVSLLIAANKTKETIGNNKEQKEVLNQLPLLFQNHPNPFNGFTFIDYFLPPNANNAFIRVVDNNGKLIKAFPINTKGYGQVELDCTNISAGTYHYTLLVDTQVIDTKSMVVTASN